MCTCGHPADEHLFTQYGCMWERDDCVCACLYFIEVGS